MNDAEGWDQRSFPRRLWFAYLVYRETGLRPMKAFRAAWFLAR